MKDITNKDTTNYDHVVDCIYQKFGAEIKVAPCSERHHLNIRGGLSLHLQNVKDIAQRFFPKDKRLAFLAAIHDIGKSQVYDIDKEGYISYREPQVDHIIHTVSMLAELGIILNPEELNALQFHHGGWSSFKGEHSELAIKLHFCDMMATANENKEAQKTELLR